MAAPSQIQDEEGCNVQGYISESSGNSAMYDNDDDGIDGIMNVNPDQKQTPGMAFGQNHNDTDIIAQMNQTSSYREPGSIHTNHTNNTTTMGEATSDVEEFPNLPTETKQYEYETDSYIQRIDSAISTLKKEINKSEQERKETEILIEQEFDNIITTLMSKKFQIILDMNSFYDNQKQQSLQRISELRKESKQKKLETIQKHKEEKQREIEHQQQLKKEQAEKAANAKKQQENEEKQQEKWNKNTSPTLQTRLSFFGDKLKVNASKLAVNATKFADTASKEILKAKDVTTTYIDSLINVDKYDVVEKDLYFKHDKIRLSVPKKDLMKLIENKIKLTTEWWNGLTLNHIIYNIKDTELWRSNDISGWYNAFGTIKVRKTQIKRWNIKICERVKQPQSGKKLPADVVLGVVESHKAKPHDKENGFWMKPFDGFGIYGYNGKIFHEKAKGKMYCNPFYAGQTIGIELNMKPTPGMDVDCSKIKPKMHLKNTKLVMTGGAVVKFYVDDEDLGIAFYDLDLNKQYSLAVALNDNAYILQLCD